MRQFNSQPEKLAAVQRLASTSRQASEERGVANASASYTASNFVDPLKQPTADSFKRAHRGGAPSSPTQALFSKFDHALKLCTSFAQFFDKPTEPSPVVYETTSDGLVRRVPSSSVATSSSSASKQPPTGAGRTLSSGPVLLSGSDATRSWTVQQLKEGDLFFFSIPLAALDATAVDHVRTRAIRHLSTIKKAFIVTPQVAKARRWFLFDMSNHIMPGIVHALSQLIELFGVHGEEAVKFPILMFREGTDSSAGHADVDGVASLHSGNLNETLNQVRFYFSKVTERRGPAAATDLFSSRRKSTYLEDLERKMAALSDSKLGGSKPVANSFAVSDDDDDEIDDDAVGARTFAPKSRGGSTARVLSSSF
jgi:hypothetical protein